MFFEFAVNFSLAITGFSMFLVLIRLVMGPHTADRVVAVDLTTSIAIAFIALYAIKSNETYILDAGLILGFVSFLGTVGYAYYLQLRSNRDE